MNTLQITLFTTAAILLLSWAVAKTEKIARARARLNWILAIAFIAFSIYAMHKSPHVVFSNDGPIGQIKRAHDAGYSKMGKVTAACFGAGLLLGLLGCATKPKPPPSDAELIEECLQIRMNCNRVPHHQNPSQHNVTDH